MIHGIMTKGILMLYHCPTFHIHTIPIIIANLRYPTKNDKFFAGERRYSHWYQKTKGLKYKSLC